MGFIVKEEVIKRPEFALYMKMNAESNRTTAKAVTAIQKQGQETLNVLKEYTIHNNHKHDETNKRVTHQGEEITVLKEVVAANEKITSFWNTVFKYLKYIVIGGLTVFGGILVKGWL